MGILFSACLPTKSSDEQSIGFYVQDDPRWYDSDSDADTTTSIRYQNSQKSSDEQSIGFYLQ